LTFPLWEGSQSGRILRRTPSHEEPDCERDSLATRHRLQALRLPLFPLAVAIRSVVSSLAGQQRELYECLVNAVNSLRVLGRRRRMIATPNQASVTMAYKEFDEAGR
jgi:hypothetical protein